MNKTINSNIIGILKQEAEPFTEWWKSNEVNIPLFNNKKLIINFLDYDPDQDKTFSEEAEQALKNFLNLTIKDRNSISNLVYNNCIDFLNEVEFDEADEPLRQISDINEIWNFVYPSEIYLKRRPYNDQNIYIQIACECDWEQEHGLQLVYRQGLKLTRISDIDGHLTEADAYDKPDEEDELLSKFSV